MNARTNTASLRKLIALRQENLDRLRQDVLRLRQLQQEARRALDDANGSLVSFLAEMRSAEGKDARLHVDRMQDRRAYRVQLDQRVAEHSDALAALENQLDQAQAALEACHREIKALERIAERREETAHIAEQRRDYRAADDAELQRLAYGSSV
jgi:flagellar export protein FliJ